MFACARQNSFLHFPSKPRIQLAVPYLLKWLFEQIAKAAAILRLAIPGLRCVAARVHISVIGHKISPPWEIAPLHRQFVKKLNLDAHSKLTRAPHCLVKCSSDLEPRAFRVEPCRAVEGDDINELNHTDIHVVGQLNDSWQLVVVG